MNDKADSSKKYVMGQFYEGSGLGWREAKVCKRECVNMRSHHMCWSLTTKSHWQSWDSRITKTFHFDEKVCFAGLESNRFTKRLTMLEPGFTFMTMKWFVSNRFQIVKNWLLAVMFWITYSHNNTNKALRLKPP